MTVNKPLLLLLLAAVLSPWTVSAVGMNANNENEMAEQPRRRKLTTGEKQEVDCEPSHQDRLFVEGDDPSRRGLTEDQEDDDDDDVGCEDADSLSGVQVGNELICDPNYSLGDNPCVDGCGHAPVPNPFNPNAVEAESEQVPSPCKDYACLCADSGCKLSWDVGCIKWYMQCQTQTQVCGSLDDAPTEVIDYNIGTSCVVAPISANVDVCFYQPLSTPSPTGSPTAVPIPPPTPAPVVPPTEAPVVPPTEAPVVPPTEAPVVPPTEAPVVPPTEAPVVPPTEAPVVPPTDVPVDIQQPIP
jgi:hypothetical protein